VKFHAISILVPEENKPAGFEFKQAKQFNSVQVFSIPQGSATRICKVPLSKPRKVEESTPATFQVAKTHVYSVLLFILFTTLRKVIFPPSSRSITQE
jgi:hypothetical protein